MSVLHCIRLLRSFKVTKASRSLAACPSFAASASSGHSRSPGQQVTSQNVCTLLYLPPQAFKVSRSIAVCLSLAASVSSGYSRSPGQQVTSQNVCTCCIRLFRAFKVTPSRMSVLRCIRLLRAFKVTRSAGHQPECLCLTVSISSGHSRSPGQQVTSQNVCASLYPSLQGIQGHQVSRSPARMSVPHSIHLLRAFKVTRSAGHQQNISTSLYPSPQDI